MKLRHWLVIAAVVLLLANVEITPADDTAEPADLIVHNGKVVTMSAAPPAAQAVAIKGDRILGVGGDDTILKK